MKDKLDRYKDLHRSGIVFHEPWQNAEKPLFPNVLIISEQRYSISNNYPFRIAQVQRFSDVLQMMKPREEKKPDPVKAVAGGGLKVRIQ
ncbi:hypothetical protein [Virgibacillus sp. 6R]|uniref:hypothetical protein n=1 Tax=Metabacillus sp. 22489 TaxID=3453928 RepID=UPI00119E51D5